MQMQIVQIMQSLLLSTISNSRAFSFVRNLSPDAQVQLGKSILAIQSDLTNTFNYNYKYDYSKNYNKEVTLSANPINFRISGLSSYQRFFSLINFLLTKIWCGIPENIKPFGLDKSKHSPNSQSSNIVVKIINLSDNNILEKSNILIIHWKIEVTRYPPTLMTYMIMSGLTRRTYIGLKYLSSNKHISFQEFKKQSESSICEKRFFCQNTPQEHGIHGYSYISFDQQGKIFSHTIDNIIPHPSFALSTILFVLFKYPLVSSRLVYLLNRW